MKQVVLSTFGSYHLSIDISPGHAVSLVKRCFKKGARENKEVIQVTAQTKLRHIVMFGFKEGTTEAEIAEIVRRFTALRDLVPGIDDFEWGVNNSPEGKSQGRTHCFTLTFGSAEARDAYLPHPDHQAFAGFARNWIYCVTVLDYWAVSD